MTHKDHVNLIRKAVPRGSAIWADLGSGWGAFTLALRDLAGPDVEIYSIDNNKLSLRRQIQNFRNDFPGSNVHFWVEDFTKYLNLPPLDGILMANSLHYVEDQIACLQRLKTYLKPNGKLVIIEYNTVKKNIWLPYPVDYSAFSDLATQAGFSTPTLLETIKLEWHDMYSAVAGISVLE